MLCTSRFPEATGLSRSSFYQAFGNKRDLNQAALDRYKQHRIDPALAEMAAPGAGRAELRMYLTVLAKLFRNDPDLAMRGCLVVNSVTELGGRDHAVRQAGIAYRKSVADAMANALRGAADDDTGQVAVGIPHPPPSDARIWRWVSSCDDHESSRQRTAAARQRQGAHRAVLRTEPH